MPIGVASRTRKLASAGAGPTWLAPDEVAIVVGQVDNPIPRYVSHHTASPHKMARATHANSKSIPRVEDVALDADAEGAHAGIGEHPKGSGHAASPGRCRFIAARRWTDRAAGRA